MCGLGGIWEAPDKWPDPVSGCIPANMCTHVPDTASIPSASGEIILIRS